MAVHLPAGRKTRRICAKGSAGMEIEMEHKMTKAEKQELIKRYVVAFALLAVTIVVLIGMFKRAQEDDKKAAADSTQIVTEQTE